MWPAQCCSPRIYVHISKSLESINVILFGERVFADLTKLKIWRLNHLDYPVDPKPNRCPHKKQNRRKHTEEETVM